LPYYHRSYYQIAFFIAPLAQNLLQNKGNPTFYLSSSQASYVLFSLFFELPIQIVIVEYLVSISPEDWF